MSLGFAVHTVGDSGGRRATLTLPHGTVETPVFMPVGTAASVKAVPQAMLETLGADGRGPEIILGNTYHLYLRPGHEAIRGMGGLHRFMSWDRPILTDSGGFQVFSLSKLRKITPDGVEFRSHLDGSKHFFSPEHSMDVQLALGSDIAMAFDECLEYPADWARARASLDLTLGWAARSKAHFEQGRDKHPWQETACAAFLSPAELFEPSDTSWGPSLRKGPADECGAPLGGRRKESGARSPTAEGSVRGARPAATVDARWSGRGVAAGARPSLFGIVQGGMFADLRRESAERLVEMDFPGYAIGGLSVGEPREHTREVIARTLESLPKDKPRYVMGVGFPEEIEEYARMGVDMMDCTIPTRVGRHGQLFTSEGRLNIKNQRFAADQGPLDPECRCPVCMRYTRAYLRHLFASGEPLAGVLNSVHNLAFYLDTMRRVREGLAAGALTEGAG